MVFLHTKKKQLKSIGKSELNWIILLTLSNFDTKQIKKYFKRVHSSKKIFHYDSSKLSHGIVKQKHFFIYWTNINKATD